MTDVDNGYDEQDGAEAMDDDVIGEDGEFRTFEELPDVLDVTEAQGDEDDDDALIAEDLDDEDIIELERDEDGDPDDVRPEVFDGE